MGDCFPLAFGGFRGAFLEVAGASLGALLGGSWGSLGAPFGPQEAPGLSESACGWPNAIGSRVVGLLEISRAVSEALQRSWSGLGGPLGLLSRLLRATWGSSHALRARLGSSPRNSRRTLPMMTAGASLQLL